MNKKVSDAEKTANVEGNWKKATQQAWVNHSANIDWLGFEATLRAYIKDTENKEVDEILAAFYGRGFTLK